MLTAGVGGEPHKPTGVLLGYPFTQSTNFEHLSSAWYKAARIAPPLGGRALSSARYKAARHAPPQVGNLPIYTIYQLRALSLTWYKAARPAPPQVVVILLLVWYDGNRIVMSP